MIDIFALADRFRADLLRRDRATSRLLVQAYADVWRRVKQELERLAKDADAAERRGERLSKAWLLRQDRLRTLERQVERQIADVGRIAGGSITADRIEAVRSAQEHARELVAASLPAPERAGVVTAFNRLPSEAVERLVGVLVRESPLTALLADLGPDAARNVRRSLLSGVALGRNPRKIAAEVKNDVGGSLVRALTISRTETLRAYRGASLASYRANDDVVKGWRWNARLDRRTCAFCWSMHNTIHPLSEHFASHPNCLTAGAVVTGARVRASTQRWYVGEVVEIETVGGHSLTVTPNHPVLTPDGWVAAGLLHEGSHVISSVNPERLVSQIDPDDYQVPALVEDVAESCGGTFPVAAIGVPTAPEDFHGDGLGSQVCVVRTDGLLWNGIDPAFPQPRFEDLFSRRYAESLLLPCGGTVDQAFDRITITAPSGVGRFSVSAALLGSAPEHQQAVGIGLPPRLHAVFQQEAPNAASSNAERGRDLILRLAGGVAPEQIIRIVRRPFSGQVYNLETTEGWYIANHIVTHNCRCAPVPITRGFRELGIDAPESAPDPGPTGVQAFGKLPASEQRQILGPAKYAAFVAGELDLEDVRGFRRDRKWGPVGYEKSLREIVGEKEAAKWSRAA